MAGELLLILTCSFVLRTNWILPLFSYCMLLTYYASPHVHLTYESFVVLVHYYFLLFDNSFLACCAWYLVLRTSYSILRTSRVILRTSSCIRRTSDFALSAAHFVLHTPYPVLHNSCFILSVAHLTVNSLCIIRFIAYFRLQTSDFRLQIQTSGFRPHTSSVRLQTSDFRLRTWYSS